MTTYIIIVLAIWGLVAPFVVANNKKLADKLNFFRKEVETETKVSVEKAVAKAKQQL